MHQNDKDKTGEYPNLDDLITLLEAVGICGLSPSQLRLLVSKGVIWGKKMGRDWFTTERAINEYMVKERKPGPKPK